MDYSSFYKSIIDRFYVEESVEDHPSVSRVRSILPDVPVEVVQSQAEVPEEHLKGRTVYVAPLRGAAVKRCPGSRGHLCCNYRTIDLYAGCSLGCSYCVMKSYLNFAPVVVQVQTGAVVRTVVELARSRPGRILRIGTGEVGDSLLYDPLFDLSRDLVTGLAQYENVFFEMKTKTDFVDHLLDLPDKGNAVMAFSLNPQAVVEAEEGTSAAVDARLAAAGRAVEAGYRLAFHFDPIFQSDTWEDEYMSLVRRLADYPAGRIAWISLGTFRYPPALKERMDDRPYLFDEFVRSKDGKFRYIQRVRVRMYRRMRSALREVTDAPVYMCMESPAVWKRVFGDVPSKIPELDGVFR